MAYAKARSEHRHGRIQARERVKEYATGGSIPPRPQANPSMGNVKLTAGSMSGEGRLQLAAHAKAARK